MPQVRYILLLILLPLFGFTSDKLAIDLKVPLSETADLTPAQLGATVYLMQSDWATVTEVGEEVAVWLTDYERKKSFLGQQVISLTLEIREPTALRTGNLIKKKKITTRYWVTSSSPSKYDQKLLIKLDSLSHELKLEAYYLGIKIESSLQSLLK